MDRRDFLRTSILGAAAVAVAPLEVLAGESSQQMRRGSNPELKISFQEGTAPGNTLGERFDFMEKNGVVGFEPGGRGLGGRIGELQQLMRGRNIRISAICAGFAGFILAEDPKVKEEFDRTMREIIVAAGELGSTGVIMVPAFNGQKPVMPHTMDTRNYLVDQLRELGEFAVQHKTYVILEPLQRREAFYLRQVADAASICRDVNHAGVKCMGDFWHMTHEETSDYGAFFSGDKHLQHVHIASRATRNMPGEDGEVDNYIDGFRALKQMNYQNYVSFECGCKTIKETAVPAALKLMREQWAKA